MDIDVFRKQLDELFDTNQVQEVEPFLASNLSEALAAEDTAAVIFILNEMVGFYRETCEYDKAILFGTKALNIIESAEGTDNIHYATTQLNLANALRAAGKLADSLSVYSEAEQKYNRFLEPGVFDFASLYNNISLVYQELGKYEEAVEYLERALKIVENYPKKRFELAVTYTNLANSMLSCGKDIEICRKYLMQAVEIFVERGEQGTHYAAALMGLGDIKAGENKPSEAAEIYKKAMFAVEHNLGRIDYYYRLKQKYDAVCDSSEGQSIRENELGLNICRAYYHEKIRPLLEKEYPEVLPHICVGLWGEGSDAFGYDDFTSRDHDWGPGVIILINNMRDIDLYSQRINSLLETISTEKQGFRGYSSDISSLKLGRRGAFALKEYYENILGREFMDYLMEPASYDGDVERLYLSVPQYVLATLVNGSVYEDNDGTATMIRERLMDYYPESLWRKLLAQELTLFSQNIQYNFRRMYQRADVLTAKIMLMNGMKNAIRIEYILRKKYLSHDKWLLRGLRKDRFGTIPGDLEEHLCHIEKMVTTLPDHDVTDVKLRPVLNAISELARYLEMQMIELGLISEIKIYMVDLVEEILAPQSKEVYVMTKEELVERIIKDEWDAFDKVINEGGRADCQDNWNTFHLMRKSQYNTWNEDMLMQYVSDFEAAVQNGWNPISEKYGRMEESTAPDKYAEICELLPKISDEKRELAESIIKIQVQWMEEFARDYPKMATNARTIHSYEDGPYNTSYETYLRGELLTYSEEMLYMYGSFVAEVAKNDGNLAYMTMEQTALLYGYESLEAAEKSL